MPQTPVQPLLRRAAPRWLRSTCAALAAFLLVTCSTDSPLAPGRQGIGSLRVVPAFNAFARVAPLTLDNVRIIVVRPPADTLVNTDSAFSATSSQLQLNIPVFLQALTEDLQVTLELYSGTVLLFRGTTTVQVSQGVRTPPDSIPVTYQGPGSQVTTLTIAPRDTTLGFGAKVPFTVDATDANAQPVAQYYVSWSTVGAATGTTVDGAGTLTAPSSRDTFYLKVVTPTGVADSTQVFVTAPASALVKSGGDQQTALAGSRLPQDLAVQVNGSDRLPVPGAVVSFAATTGGGTVDSATATADAQGIARSGAILGATVGAQTFTASATGLTSVVFAETATSASGVATWTGATGSGWDIAANWNPAALPLTTNDVVIPSGTLNSPILNSSVSVHSLTVQTGATLTLVDVALGIGGNLDASGSIAGCCSEVVSLSNGSALRGNFSQIALTIPAGAVVTMNGNVTLTTGSQVSIDGELVLNGHTLDAGLADGFVLTNQQTGLVTMTNPADLLIALLAGFNGADETGHLTAGIIQTQNLASGGLVPTSFFASGTNKVKLGGPQTSTLSFTVAASARLQDLDVSAVTGTMLLYSNVTVAGQLISHPTGATPIIGAGAPGAQVITAAGVDISALGIDQHTLTIGAGTITQFDNVAFTGQAATATALTVTNAGAATPYTFNGLSFAVTPTSGLYLAATDLGGAAPFLTINMATATPAAPPANLFSAAGGAVINWPGIGGLTWTGAASTDFGAAGNWSPAQTPTSSSDLLIPAVTRQPSVLASSVVHNVTVQSGATLTIAAGQQLTVNGNFSLSGTAGCPASSCNLTVVGNVTTLAGSTLNPSVLNVAGSLSVAGTFAVSSNTLFTGTGQLIPAGLPYTNMAVTGTASLTGRTPVGVSVTVGGVGNLTLNGHTLLAGLVQVGNAAGDVAVLTMTNALDSVITTNMTFDAGSEAGSLTTGVIVVAGNFNVLSTNNSQTFAASGNHKTVFTGTTLKNINIMPLGANSHFQDLDVSAATGGLDLLTNVTVLGQIISTPTGTVPMLQGTGVRLSAGGANVTGLTLDTLPLLLTNGTISAFNNVLFQHQNPTGIALTVNNAGTVAPFVFDGLSFTTVLGAGGFHLLANDLLPSDGVPLTLNLTNATPASGAGVSQATNGAVINWPASAPAKTWAGTVSTAWNTAGNWSPSGVPTASDNVVIPAGTPFGPLVSFNNDSTLDLTVNSGAILQLAGGGITLTAMGNVNAAGRIDAINTGSGILKLAGSGKTLAGTFGQGAVFGAVLSIQGSYTLAGRTVSTNAAEVRGAGAHLTLAGHTFSVAGAFNVGIGSNLGLITMTNPLDSLLANGTAGVQFVGSDETGQLTAGVLVVGGPFLQGGTTTTSFVASGTHKTVFRGGQTLTWTNPGASHLNDVDVSNAAAIGTVQFGASTIATGQLISLPSGSSPFITGTLTAVGANVTGLQSQAQLILNGGTITAFANVTFVSTPVTGAALTVQGTGAGGPLTFTNLSFANSPGGFYISATDVDGATSGVLTINMVTPTPATPGAFVQTSGGALVNWPISAPTITWTGSVSTDWSNASNWTPAQVPTAANPVLIPATTNKPAITSSCAAKSILVNSGGRIDVGIFTCQVSGDVISTGIIAGTTGAIQIVAAGQISGNLPGLIASAPVTVATGGATTGSGNGNVTISGAGAQLILNGQTLTAPGNLLVQTSGVLVMNNPADVLTIFGTATFNGGSESGQLTAGTLTVYGNFSQAATSSPSSFLASGSHRTVLGGPSQSVSFANPATSHFQDLDITVVTGALTLGSNVTAVGQLVSVPGGLGGPAVSGAGFTLTAGGADISAPQGITALTMSGVPLVLSGGTITGVSNVTFTNQNPAGTALTVNNVGQAAHFTFSNLNFTTTLTAGGLHLKATDLDGATPNALTIDMIGDTPAAPPASAFSATGGAVINWPPVGTAITWTGAVSQNWNVANNWSPAQVPSAIDDVTLVPITNQPVLSSSVAIHSLTSTAGSILDIGGLVLVIGGDANLAGTINGSPGSGVSLSGTGAQTLHGTFNTTVAVTGSYQLNGNLTMAGDLAVDGSLNLSSFAATVTGNFLTNGSGLLVMTTAGGILDVSGDAIFTGGNTNGLLTAGTLRVGGNFDQFSTTSAQSFAASPGHLTVLGANPATILFQTPGANLSHFGDLSEAGFGAQFVLGSDLTILGFLSGADGFGGNFLGTNCPTTLTVTQWNNNSTLDCVKLVIDDPTGTTFGMSNVTFLNLPTNVTQLTINHPGLASGFWTTSNLNFVPLTTGDAGHYIHATDTDGSSPFLAVSIFASNVLNGSQFTTNTPGVSVIWPNATLTWTGAVDTNWTNAGNWDLGLIPNPASTAVVPAGPANQPHLAGTATVAALSITGGNLTLTGTMNVLGDFSTTGTGTITMNTSASNALNVSGNASFAGGSTAGLLTQGTITVAGNFTQSAAGGSTLSFAPSGTHMTTVGSGSATTIDFGSPGSGGAGSHFQNLDLSNATGGVSLTVNTIVDALFQNNTSGVTIHGGGASLTARGWSVSTLTVDNAPMILDDGGVAGLATFNNVRFTGFPQTGVTQLTVRALGGGGVPRTLTFNNTTLSHLTTVGGGSWYVSLEPILNLDVIMLGSSENPLPPINGNGPTFSRVITTNGAGTVTW